MTMLTASTTRPMTTAEIKAAMIERYAAPEFALLFEVGSGTGANLRTFADAVAMSLWPSRGLELLGFEFKASRSDWKRELALPKAEPVARFCDRWYVVAAAGVIADKAEVPAGWGYILADGGKLRTVREAPPQEHKADLTRAFLAALLRRASEHDAETVRTITTKELAKAEMEWRRRADAERTSRLDKLSSLQKAVADFEAASGIQITSYTDGKELGAAVRLGRLMAANEYSQLAQAARSAKSFVERANKIMAELGVDGVLRP